MISRVWCQEWSTILTVHNHWKQQNEPWELSWTYLMYLASWGSNYTWIWMYLLYQFAENFVHLRNHGLAGTYKPLASFPGSRVREEEREPGTHCLRMRQVPLVTCILLRCTKITINSVYLLKGRTAWLYSFWDSYGRFLSQKQYHFNGDSLHCFVRSDQWTSKERLRRDWCSIG